MFKETSRDEPGLRKRREVLKTLSRFGSLSEPLIMMMGMPEKLFSNGSVSFSSERGAEVFASAPTMLRRLRMVDDVRSEFITPLPAYAIHIAEIEGEVCCAMLDKSRGLFVSSPLTGGFLVSPWKPFEAALDAAIEISNALEVSRMVVSNGTVIRILGR